MSSDQKPTLCLDGALGLRDVEAIKQRLLDLLSTGTSVHVDAKGLTEIDVSILQILIAAQKSAAQRGVTLTLGAPANGALVKALERGGFRSKASPRSMPASGSVSQGAAA